MVVILFTIFSINMLSSYYEVKIIIDCSEESACPSAAPDVIFVYIRYNVQ